MRKSLRAQDASEVVAVVDSDSATDSKPVESMDAHGSDGADYEELGEHVASVLKAAELAAREIRTKAEQEAEAQVTEAGRQAGKILHDAEGLRAEAEAYAARTRQDADAQASKALQDAEETAADRTREEDERQRALREDIERSKKRLTELGAGLRDLATRLDELVGLDPADDGVQRRTGESASLDTSLIASIGERTADAKS
jgi:DNA repair exonuclease SbcCD ATPase subunit